VSAGPLLSARGRISGRSLQRQVPRFQIVARLFQTNASAAAGLALFAIFDCEVHFLRFRAAGALKSRRFHKVTSRSLWCDHAPPL
jgi:hypothetical protein